MKSSPLPDLEDRLESLEPQYVSEAEQRIGQMLDGYGILFYYRQPRIVLTEKGYERWHPAFTLPYHNDMVIEYAGPMDDPLQRAQFMYREQVYRYNQILAIFLDDSPRRYLPGPGLQGGANWPPSSGINTYPVQKP